MSRAFALSVSTIGTNELQPNSETYHSERGRLSVSTIGTNELQHPTGAQFSNQRVVFQFPQSERMSCNKNVITILKQAAELSVSTIGTNELQLLAIALIRARITSTFSFHNRNE